MHITKRLTFNFDVIWGDGPHRQSQLHLSIFIRLNWILCVCPFSKPIFMIQIRRRLFVYPLKNAKAVWCQLSSRLQQCRTLCFVNIFFQREMFRSTFRNCFIRCAHKCMLCFQIEECIMVVLHSLNVTFDNSGERKRSHTAWNSDRMLRYNMYQTARKYKTNESTNFDLLCHKSKTLRQTCVMGTILKH